MDRGLQGMQLVVSDAHTGVKAVIGAVFQEASWQRCKPGTEQAHITIVPGDIEHLRFIGAGRELCSPYGGSDAKAQAKEQCARDTSKGDYERTLMVRHVLKLLTTT